MKKILVLLVLLASSSLIFAQQNYQDVVYLKNGSIIRGTIIEQVPNQSIKIETADRSVFVYQLSEIERITKEAVRTYTQTETPEEQTFNGYSGMLEIGYGNGILDYEAYVTSLTSINGYRFNPYIAIGAGTGFKANWANSDFYIPVFLNVRVNFLRGKISPYLSLNAGYDFGFGTDGNLGYDDSLGDGNLDDSRAFINPNIGVSFKFTGGFGMFLSVGYEGLLGGAYTAYHSSSYASCLNVKFGFIFGK
jgi:hypothetical protein